MAVTTGEMRTSVFVCNGAQKEFPFGFPFLDAEHIHVYTNDGEVTSGFTVVRGTTGGKAVFDEAPVSGTRLTVMREVPYSQETDIQNNTAFLPEVLETMADKLTMEAQQLAEKLDRAVKVDPVSSETPEQLRDRLLATGSSAASSAEVASGWANSALSYMGQAGGFAASASMKALEADVHAGSASAAASAASAARDEAREAVTREQILEYASGSAYAALTCLVYNGGGYQVTSDTVAGENPDNTPGKFRCFASAGATIIGISEQVTSLTSGAIVVTRNAVPVALKTSSGKFYYLEKETVSISGGVWTIDPAAYIAYAKESAFAGPWTVYYAGGVPDSQPIVIGSGGAVVLHENQVYQVALTSGAVISVNSSGLTSSVCVTQELWIDMPSTAVSFSLPGLTWIDGIVPDFAAGNTRYVLTVRWNGTKFLANSAYEESLA